MTVDLPIPARALAIGAHPDDVEFGCGATLAKWAASGCAIWHLICTDGSKGTWNPNEDITSLVERRHDEQRAASRALGGKADVVFLDWTDGELESGLQQRWQVAYWIRRIRPEVVLGHDPWRRYRLHPDHRNAGFLATDGVVAARDPHYFPEQLLEHHRPSSLLLWETEEPDHFEDVTGLIDTKIRALLEHHSQFRSTMGIEDPADPEQIERFRGRVTEQMSQWGAQAGVAHAEGFKAITRI